MPEDLAEPLLLGVINLSPESMVADSIVDSPAALASRAASLRDAGVEVFDLGGRSITPDAPMIDDAEEQRRLRPAVEQLKQAGRRVSVDTWSAATAREALRWGADWINFTGEELPDTLLQDMAQRGASLVLTYMPYGNAYEMRSKPRIAYSMARIVDFLGARAERARDAGISEIYVDPNIGILHAATDDFAKIHLQYEVLAELDALRSLGCPLMLYAARKPERLARIMMAEAVLRAAPRVIRTHEPEILQQLLAARRERQRNAP